MKFTLLFSLFFGILNSFAEAEDLPPITPPVGVFTHKGDLKPKFSVKFKTFLHDEEEAQDAIKSLKKQGYWCFRRSLKETKCQLKKAFTEFPEGTSKMTLSLLKNSPVHFPEQFNVELYHDGSSTKEWLVHGVLTIGGKKMNVYRITLENTGRVSFSFPVDEENGFGLLYVHGDKTFGFPLTLKAKEEEGWTTSYFFDALYTPN